MRKKIIACFLTFVMIFLLPACAESSSEVAVEPVKENEDAPVRAQDDFYGYVNKDFLLEAEVDYQYGSYSEFIQLIQKTKEDLNDIISEIVESGKEYEEGTCEWAVAEFYNQVLEYETDDSIKASHRGEVEKLIEEIVNCESAEELMQYAIRNKKNYGIPFIFTVGSLMDVYNSDELYLAIVIDQTLLNTNLKDIQKEASMAVSIKNAAFKALNAMGYDNEYVDAESRKVAYLAIDMANNMILPQNDEMGLEDVQLISKDEIRDIFANVGYEKMEKEMGIDKIPYDGLHAYVPDDIKYLKNIISDDNLEELKVIELYGIFQTYGEVLDGGKYDAMSFTSVNNSTSKQKAAYETRMNLEEELSYIYANRFYTDEMEEDVQKIYADIIGEYKNIISEADWLTKDTRNRLLRKVENIVLITPNYERNRENKSDYLFGNDYFETLQKNRVRMYDNEMNSVKEKVDKSKSNMSSQTVNACYTVNNTVTICAAILQGGIYNHDADYIQNLARLGCILAHEIGHGFDDNGIKYDENGNYNPEGICAEDWAVLEAKNQQAIEYFENAFKVFNVYHINGEKSLGENFADLGGMEVCIRLCKTEDEKRKLMESYAFGYASLSDAEETIGYLSTDPHSPDIIRVNAVVATMDEFYEIYDVKEGDGMYIPSEKRVSRWY